MAYFFKKYQYARGLGTWQNQIGPFPTKSKGTVAGALTRCLMAGQCRPSIWHCPAPARPPAPGLEHRDHLVVEGRVRGEAAHGPGGEGQAQGGRAARALDHRLEQEAEQERAPQVGEPGAVGPLGPEPAGRAKGQQVPPARAHRAAEAHPQEPVHGRPRPSTRGRRRAMARPPPRR